MGWTENVYNFCRHARYSDYIMQLNLWRYVRRALQGVSPFPDYLHPGPRFRDQQAAFCQFFGAKAYTSLQPDRRRLGKSRILHLLKRYVSNDVKAEEDKKRTDNIVMVTCNADSIPELPSRLSNVQYQRQQLDHPDDNCDHDRDDGEDYRVV